MEAANLETRWIILGTDGRHVTLGWRSDPSPDELAQAEAGLAAQGLAGWLAVMKGGYYTTRTPDLMMVRPLCDPKRLFAEAVDAFQAVRKATLDGLKQHRRVVDRFTPEARSRLMASIRRKDTKPEMVVRRLLHAMGYRFRLHRRDLPGTPDIVLPGRRVVIFVHGCFWHRHKGCRLAAVPATHRDFWEAKIAANRARDRRAVAQLRRAGWRITVVWECQTRMPAGLDGRLRRFLESG